MPIAVPDTVALAAWNGLPWIRSTIAPPEVRLAAPPRTSIVPLMLSEFPAVPVLNVVLLPVTPPMVRSPFCVATSTGPVPPMAERTISGPVVCCTNMPLPLKLVSEVTCVSSGLPNEPMIDPDAESVRPVIRLFAPAATAPGWVTEPALIPMPFPAAVTGALRTTEALSPVASRSTVPPVAVTAPLTVNAFPAPRAINWTL